MDAREQIARVIEPQAWAALGIGDTLAYKNRRTSSLRKADRIIASLAADSRQIIHCDENHGPTLERAAAVAENLGGTWTGSRDAFSCAQEAAVDDKCEEIAGAIRAMGEKK